MKRSTEKQLSFFWRIYSYRFFDDLIIVYPLYAVMFADYGVSPAQIGILLAAWAFTGFILEVPSGVLADRFSRKQLLIIGQVIRLVGYGCWLVFPTFWGFLAGFILWGIKSALSSGTFEALVYDNLKEAKKTSLYEKVAGRSVAAGTGGMLIASLAAAGAVGLGYQFVLLMSMAAVAGSVLMATTLPETRPAKSTGERSYGKLFIEGLRVAKQTPIVVRIIAIFFLIAAVYWSHDEFIPLFLERGAGVPKWGLGLAVACVSIGWTGGGFIAHRFKKMRPKAQYFLFAIAGSLVAVAALFGNIWAVIPLAISAFVIMIPDTILEAQLQHAVPSNIRATVASVKSVFVEAGVIGGTLLLGLLVEAYSYRTAFLAAGILSIAVSLIFILLPEPQQKRIKS